jgi:hypothetical protein
VDARWVKRGRVIVVAVVAGVVVLVVAVVAIRVWNQRQERGVAQAGEQLDAVATSLPAATATPAPTPTPPIPTPTPPPTPLPTPAPFVHVTAVMAAVPGGPGPVVVPVTLTVRIEGDAPGGPLDARLDGDGYLQVGTGAWYTDIAPAGDGTGTAWEVATQVAVDAFRGSGVLTWTLTWGENERGLPLQWRTGQGVIREEARFGLDAATD